MNPEPTMRLETTTYAKINLGLLIHARRNDGFHEIETVFHRVDISDRLVFEPAEEILIATESPEIPTDESNLCWKAAAAINHLAGTNHGVKITLEKNIPTGGGLGGGSADAACVLRVLPGLWNVQVSEEKLAECARDLGSDVPFFLGRDSAHGTGRGEQLSFFHLDFPFAIVVCYPGTHVSTSWAYQQIRTFRTRERGILGDRLRAALRRPGDLCRVLENDFESAVFDRYPEIAELKRSLLKAGAFCAALSGSGSSVYGLFAGEHTARHAAQLLRTDRIRTFFSRSGFQIPETVVP